MTAVWLATEDPLSAAVAERLLTEAIPDADIAPRFDGQGAGNLKKALPKLVNLARTVPGLLLTDLDRTDCPLTLIGGWVKARQLPDTLLFRIAVREIEAWLMADRDGFSNFSGIPKPKLPQAPEAILDPKETLLALVRKYAPKHIKADLLPDPPNQTATRGLGYNACLSAFVRVPDGWSPIRAAENADSLRRARVRLADLAAKLSASPP